MRSSIFTWFSSISLILSLLLVYSSHADTATTRRRQTILEDLLNSSNSVYDARVPPNFEEDFPTDVSVQMYVLNFDSLTEISMEYSLTIFLRQQWLDHRLAWNDSKVEEPLEVDPKLMGRVWQPDLYFLNEKEAIVHDVTVVNKLMHIYKDGTLHTSIRISMTLNCDLHLERYPHDEQTCSIFAGSYSYSRENVVLKWHESALELRESLTLPRFTVERTSTKYCDDLDFGTSIITGNFSCIQVDFFLRRQFGYYIAQVYIPSVLIVVLSWVSFWIDIDAIPARVSLGLLTVLAITTQSTGEKSALPRVSYVKALDIWMAVCLMFVFMALLEFSYVNVQCRVQKRRQETIVLETSNKDNPQNGKDTISVETPESANPRRRFVFFRDKMKVQRARAVDKFSRVIFPLLFLLFNISYWFYYLYF